MKTRLVLLAAAGLAIVEIGSAQVVATLRLRGTVLARGGAPISGGHVRTDAVAGPSGAQFVGERHFAATSGAKGEWAILGITRGVWIFEASAAGHAPSVVGVTVNLMHPDPKRPVTWELPLYLLSLDEIRAAGGSGKSLADDLAPAVAEGRFPSREEALRLLGRERETPLEGIALCAVGHLALLVRDLTTALASFERAGAGDPCGPLGIASVSLLSADFDTAVTAYDHARKATRDQKLQRVISAVIADLQKLVPLR
jgi:hypothetical protein